MIHEIAFAVEAGVASKLRPSLVPRIVGHRVPRFGVAGHKIAQIVANRPDVQVAPRVRRVLDDSLARVVTGAGGGVRASVATVSRSACGAFAVKRLNDPTAPAALRAAAAVARVVRPEIHEIVLGPLADEFALETELAKNRDLRRALAGVRRVVVPRVVSASAGEVVMDFQPSVLVRDLVERVPLSDVRAFFRECLTRFAASGVFHCDMHSANVGVADDGSFVVYDFGSVRRVDAAGLVDPITALVALDAACVGDWEAVADAALDSGVLVRGDRDVVAVLLRACARYATGRADAGDLRPAFASAGGSVRMSADAAAVSTAAATLEATCKRMNPAFDAAGAFGFGVF